MLGGYLVRARVNLKSVEARRKFVQTCRCKGAICEVDGFTHFGAANFSPVK